MATQNRWRQRGLVPTEKSERVANYARAVREDLMVMTRAVGLHSPAELSRHHVEIVIDIGKRMRVSDLYPYEPQLLQIANLDELRAARIAG